MINKILLAFTAILMMGCKHLIVQNYAAVTGLCHGITSGQTQISYEVEGCESTVTSAPPSMTGWGSSFLIEIEEINIQSYHTCIEGAPVLCNGEV